MISGSFPGQIFGTGQGTESVRHSFQGQPDWWSVPTAWSAKMDRGQWYVSPNADFSSPVYAAKLNLDGFLVYQDMMRQRMTGPASPQGSP